ncbi:MAG: hypothetical protein MSIBF_00055 [Candidatus Altiarchaeales archaeon IMC4]|nr:MAG: hypothetical protein MSIBF_00055 [Candidatus Altiarchaeales archaeon IMC4]
MDEQGMGKTEWQGVKATLSDMAEDYDDTNNKISLGMVNGWRTRAARESQGIDTALEIGSGPGTLAVKLMSKKIICLDPLPKMHDAAKRRIPSDMLEKFEFIVGSGEEIPLADESVDIVYCSFSFRDFYDKQKGLSEIRRVLKKNGRLVILDIGKPGKIRNALMHFYFRNVAPILAPKNRQQMRWLAKTYKAFGSPAYYSDLAAKTGFKKVDIKSLCFGAAFMLLAKK